MEHKQTLFKEEDVAALTFDTNFLPRLVFTTWGMICAKNKSHNFLVLRLNRTRSVLTIENKFNFVNFLIYSVKKEEKVIENSLLKTSLLKNIRENEIPITVKESVK